MGDYNKDKFGQDIPENGTVFVPPDSVANGTNTEASGGDKHLAEKNSAKPENAQALTGIVLDAALRTSAVILAIIILFTTMLSFVHPKTANVYYNLGLYEKAVVAAERDFLRKQNKIDRYHETSEFYQEYYSDTYMPSLTRLCDYSIAWSYRNGGKKAAGYIDKYAQRFLEKDNLQYSGALNISNMEKLPVADMILVYDYRAYLKYNLLRAAITMQNDSLRNERIAAYFEGDMLSRILIYEQDQTREITQLYGEATFFPNWAMKAYFEYMLGRMEYKYPASKDITRVFASEENIRKAINPDEYYSSVFAPLYSKATGFTTLYNNIEKVYNSLKTIRDSKNFDTLSNLSARLEYLWYDRIISEIAYSMASVFCIISVMNTNSFTLNPYYDLDIHDDVKNVRDTWENNVAADALEFENHRQALIR